MDPAKIEKVLTNTTFSHSQECENVVLEDV